MTTQVKDSTIAFLKLFPPEINGAVAKGIWNKTFDTLAQLAGGRAEDVSVGEMVGKIDMLAKVEADEVASVEARREARKKLLAQLQAEEAADKP